MPSSAGHTAEHLPADPFLEVPHAGACQPSIKWSDLTIPIFLPASENFVSFFFLVPFFHPMLGTDHSACKWTHLPLPPVFRTTVSIEWWDPTIPASENFHHRLYLVFYFYSMVGADHSLMCWSNTPF